MNIFKPEKKTMKNQKTRKPRLYRQALCLVSILSLIIVQAGALLLRPVPVLASEGAAAYNVAGYILSLLTSYNTALTNQTVYNAIVTQFGNMDCATASANQIEAGLTAIANQTGFNLAPIFASSAEEAAEIAAVYVDWGETTIAAASAGTNIEAGAKALALSAAGGAGAAVLPAIGGVVLPGAAAVGLGIAGGFLINHIRTAIQNRVRTGYSLDAQAAMMNRYPNGINYVRNQWGGYFTWPYGTRIAPYWAGGYMYCAGKGYNGAGGQMVYIDSEGYVQSTTTIPSNGIGIWSRTTYEFWPGITKYNSESEATAYLNTFNSGQGQQNMSPDIVGNTGNQTGLTEDGQYTIPNINPIYNYGNTYVTYIEPSDYQDYINLANTNTNNGDVDMPTQGEDFDTFINPYIQPVPNPNPDPNPDPDPTSVPQPTQVPIEGINPVPDPQPTSAPLPTPSPEEEEQLPEGMTNPDWKEKFPFCIPYDILAFMQIWQEARSAPRFEFDLSFGTDGRYGLGVVVIDLSPFDSAAQLLRLLQLILFIVGLAIGTHKLLNPSGGGGD